MSTVKTYSPLEESLNIWTHACGLFLSCLSLFLVLMTPELNTSIMHTLSFSTFSISLIILYAASTFYHRAVDPIKRARLRIFDHAAIYILIAGSYTPFTLVALNSSIGWTVFYLAWGMAITGVIFKVFFTGRFSILSTTMYVLMGCMVFVFYDDLQTSLSSNGLWWLKMGGLSYIVGAVIYSIKAIKFNHAIFHVFVLFGSISHFIAAYRYIIPQ